jgi:hypothetical protein
MPRSHSQIEPTERTRGERLQRLRQKVFATYGDACWLCGGGGADTIDHLIPLSEGGDDHIDNLRPAHGKKSSHCVGNFSRKRPSYPGEQLRIKKPQSDEPDGITYGDGWISRKRNGMTSTMYLDVTGLEINDPMVQAFING